MLAIIAALVVAVLALPVGVTAQDGRLAVLDEDGRPRDLLDPTGTPWTQPVAEITENVTTDFAGWRWVYPEGGPTFVFAEPDTDELRVLGQRARLVHSVDDDGTPTPVTDDIGQHLWALGQEPCAVRGVYRPFEWFERFQLATSYFVNPTLPQRARVRNAYPLQDVVRIRGAEWVLTQVTGAVAQIYAPLATGAEAWAPVQGPCQLGVEATDRAVQGAAIEMRYVGPGLEYIATDNPDQWIDNIPGYVDGDLRLLSTWDLLPDEGQPVISWDPEERVAIVQEQAAANTPQ